MKINLSRFERTQTQKESIRKKLEIPDGVQIDLALDTVHGINDLARSLADLHPHKKSIAVLGVQPPPMKEVSAGFARSGFAVQEIPISLAHPDEKAFMDCWQTLKKDTLFVLGHAIEPFTGIAYPFDWVRREGPSKQIFSLIYQSPDSLQKGLIVPQTPWEGIVADPLWAEDQTLALVIKGERCQGDRLLWGEPHFSDGVIDLLSERIGTRSLDDQKAILAFEKKVTETLGASVGTLDSGCARLFDRAVLFVQGLNGDALCFELAKRKFEAYTSAACAWGDPHLNSWLPKLGFTEEMAQSSIIIPLKTLKQRKFMSQFFKDVEKLREISGSNSKLG